MLDEALSPKTKAVFLDHTLGNPFDIESVYDFCEKHGLWLIEDNCDALGSRYLFKGEWCYTGVIGDIGTSSFYPPHHITLGEGGAVYTATPLLKQLVESFRDWGRDCCCPPGCDDTCSKRFTKQFGELPLGYDHKYVYSHFGYNLKATDLQAAIGCAQLEKLPSFIAARKRNWALFKTAFSDLEDIFILPEAEKNSDPSWFGFILTVRNGVPVTRDKVVRHLESRRIQTRMLFAGNIIKHPCFDAMRSYGHGYRVVGSMVNTDLIMNNSLWLGVYPGMTEDMATYVIDTVRSAVGR
jgi:CDP-6-deoxy-D-xylo-4-hexulose-3-dehydrase